MATGVADAIDAVMDRLVAEDAAGQLLTRSGRMAELATEADRPRLDWVGALGRWLDEDAAAARLEEVADTVLGGAGRLLWSGMGGSVVIVECLRDLGLLEGAAAQVRPLSSTDPRALNEAAAWLDGEGSALAVSMGLTSAEPLSHLEWLADPAFGRVRPTVMTLPESVLAGFAAGNAMPQVDVQPDGRDGTPGRMSAPGTHVFLLPALLAAGSGSALRSALSQGRGWMPSVLEQHSRARRDQAARDDPAIRLACRLHLQLQQGRNKALVVPDGTTDALVPWVEQLVEESLGKRGGGLLVFPRQDPSLIEALPDDCFLLSVSEALPEGWSADGVGGVAALCASWTLTVAMLGYLEGITFAGQPAVEAYKRYARELREREGPVQLPAGFSAERAVQRARERLARDPTGYLDVTLNAAASTPGWRDAVAAATRMANRQLRRPAKARVAPGHYHSTEQAQVDGPPGVASIRIVLRRTEDVLAGAYDIAYLHAQALGAARAMVDAGRAADLVVVDDAGGLSAVTAAMA